MSSWMINKHFIRIGRAAKIFKPIIENTPPSPTKRVANAKILKELVPWQLIGKPAMLRGMYLIK